VRHLLCLIGRHDWRDLLEWPGYRFVGWICAACGKRRDAAEVAQ